MTFLSMLLEMFAEGMTENGINYFLYPAGVDFSIIFDLVGRITYTLELLLW